MRQPKDKSGRALTLKQVAEAAGVHASTASRALNPATRAMVVPEVAARVIKIANSLGYRPDPVAASLRTGRSKLIGVLLPDIANTVFAPILSGASERLSAHGYSVIVADVGNEPEQQIDLALGLVARRVDGLILATVTRDDPLVAFCLERGLPVVLVNRSETQARVSAVVSDDGLGMQLAVDHLVGLGHRRIAHLAGPAEHSTGFLRQRGFVHALIAHDMDATAAPCETASAFARHEGAVAARRLLDKHADVTGIVCANDLLALGVYDVLRERGLKCPGDISVVGHNDMPLADIMDPGLTTVRISHQEMGRQAAELLVQAMDLAESPVRNVVLPSKLIIRGSTAVPSRKAEVVPGERAAARSRKAKRAP